MAQRPTPADIAALQDYESALRHHGATPHRHRTPVGELATRVTADLRGRSATFTQGDVEMLSTLAWELIDGKKPETRSWTVRHCIAVGQAILTLRNYLYARVYGAPQQGD